ncbi:hypothetical protein [Citrobacter freundii]
MTALNKQALIAKIKKQTESFDTVVLKEDEANLLLNELESAENRIAELEARSISLTMPPRKTVNDYIDDEFDNSDLAAIYNACRLECEVKFKNACRAAGIGVKGE